MKSAGKHAGKAGKAGRQAGKPNRQARNVDDDGSTLRDSFWAFQASEQASKQAGKQSK